MKRVLLSFICFCAVLPVVQSQGYTLPCSNKGEQRKIDSLLADIDSRYLRSDLFKRFRQNRLKDNRTLPPVLLQWPLQAKQDYRDEVPNYYVITNFVDIDQADTTNMFDYTCEERTYDGHRGSDIVLFPFMWDMMEEEYVEVIAAADGIVSAVHDDENNDYNCEGCESANSDNNGVILLHADSSKTIYYHIKTGSATVAEEDTVHAGDVIALVASSGCSTGPHLHFEVRDPDNEVVEPFEGPCNTTTTESWWINQKPYWVPEVNRVMTHYAEPALIGLAGHTDWCPESEFKYARNDFEPGDEIFYGVAVKDYQSESTISIDVYDPTGSSFYDAGAVNLSSTVSARYLFFSDEIPSDAMEGTYKIWVEYGTEDYYHYFSVGCKDNYTLSGSQSSPEGYIAGNRITTSRSMSEPESLLLQSALEIKMVPGFHALSQSQVLAVIRGCNFMY